MKTVFVIILAVITLACFIAAGVMAFASNIFTEGFNLNFINGEAKKMNINMVKPYDLAGVEKVKVFMQVGEAVVSRSDKMEANLTGFVMGNPDRIIFTAEKSGSELDITVKLSPNFWNMIVNDVDLKVGLPADYNGILEVNGTTAKIDVDDFTLASLKSKVTTGNLTVNACAKTVELESSTGSITLNGKNRDYENITIHSTTGHADVSALRASQITCGSTTGRLTLKDVKAQKISASATTGKVTLENCEGSVDARAMTGSVEARMNAIGESYFETTTGRVELYLPAELGFNMDARSTTGRINTDYTFMGELTGERKFSAGAEIKGGTNGGGQDIKIRTTTGGIEILKNK